MIETSPNPRFVRECEEFLDAWREGDCILEYCTSKQSWNQGMGRAGFILLRDGQSIAALMTRMN
jgi:hypothetical protein